MSDQNGTEREFWMVWNGNGRTPPTTKQNSLANAQAEAMRLAGLQPGLVFYVLKAMNAYAAEIEIKPVFLDSVPAEDTITGSW